MSKYDIFQENEIEKIRVALPDSWVGPNHFQLGGFYPFEPVIPQFSAPLKESSSVVFDRQGAQKQSAQLLVARRIFPHLLHPSFHLIASPFHINQ